jgi:glycerol-3-phosphate dehydrogenase (NAD(P)+)
VIGIYAGTPIGSALGVRLAADGRVVKLARDPSEVGRLKEVRLVLVDATPAELRSVAQALGNVLDGGHLVAHTVRGLLPDGGRPTEVLHDETAVRRLGVLAGPLVPADLEAGRPAAGVVASHHPEVVEEFAAELSTPKLRIYRARDPIGIELAAALSDLVVVGVGVAHALGLNETAVTVLLVRAIRELGRLISAAGGDPESATGLSGLGDVLVRAHTPSSPTHALGERLAAGDAGARAQLAPAVLALRALDRRPHGSTHIFAGLAALIDGKLTPAELITRLMTLPVLDE